MIVRVFFKLKMNSLKEKENEDWIRKKRALKAVLLLTPLLGLTWVFGVFAFNEATKWILYVFSIFNALQVQDTI